MRKIATVTKRTARVAVGILLLFAAEAAMAVPIPGPDAFGHVATEISNNIRDIRTTGTQISLDDDDITGAINLDFDFDFYGTTYTEIYVSSNGFITFEAGSIPGEIEGDTLGDSIVYQADNLIAGLWGDLNSANNTTGTMFYENSATEFVVGFYEVAHYSNNSLVTFEITLHQGSNNIEFQYGEVSSGVDLHTVGISNMGDTDALAILNAQGPTVAELSDRGYQITAPAQSVPAPGTLALIGLGSLGLLARRGKRRKTWKAGGLG